MSPSVPMLLTCAEDGKSLQIYAIRNLLNCEVTTSLVAEEGPKDQSSQIPATRNETMVTVMGFSRELGLDLGTCWDKFV